MTYEEAEICFEKGFPVVCTKCPGFHYEYMVGQIYCLCSIHKCISTDNINKNIQSTFGVQKEGINEGTLKPDEMEPLNSFNIQVQKFLKSRKAAQFKALIKELLAAGLTQTRIIEKVKSIIKELKAKEKTAND